MRSCSLSFSGDSGFLAYYAWRRVRLRAPPARQTHPCAAFTLLSALFPRALSSHAVAPFSFSHAVFSWCPFSLRFVVAILVDCASLWAPHSPLAQHKYTSLAADPTLKVHGSLISGGLSGEGKEKQMVECGTAAFRLLAVSLSLGLSCFL